MEITSVRAEELTAVRAFYADVIQHLRAKRIYQWNRLYPNRFIIAADVKNGHLYGMKRHGVYAGVIVLNQKQSGKYEKLTWEDKHGIPLCIHRLAVHPQYQGKGVGKQLLTFAEEYAIAHGHSSIRLDVYTENPTAVNMYERAGYQTRGEIHFPLRQVPYICLEKLLK